MAAFTDVPVHVRFKLAALWASVTLCYLYGDYFGLYVPGKLQNMIDGRMGPMGLTTQAVLVKATVMMAIPSLMVFLALTLRPALNRWVNIVFGIAFTAIMAITMSGAWNFYLFLGVVEMGLTLAIVWYAWRWPRERIG